MNDLQPPLVSVRCIVYNQVKYVERTLRGFVEQQTNFPFVVLVHDDASTDGSDAVIRKYAEEYPDIIKAVIEPAGNNLYKKHALGKFMLQWTQTTNCKYVARCEGDDYWNNPNKLQMQVDYMEAHSDCVMCFTDCHVCDDNGHIVERNFVSKHTGIPHNFQDHLFRAGYIAPPTWLMRADVLYTLGPYQVVDGSLAMALDFFQKGLVSYLDEVTAVYTISEGSVSRPQTSQGQWHYAKGIFDIQMAKAEEYHCSEDVIDRLRMQGYTQLILPALEANNKTFIKEAETYYKSHGLEMDCFIENCKEYVCYHKDFERINASKAYQFGTRIRNTYKSLLKRK